MPQDSNETSPLSVLIIFVVIGVIIGTAVAVFNFVSPHIGHWINGTPTLSEINHFAILDKEGIPIHILIIDDRAVIIKMDLLLNALYSGMPVLLPYLTDLIHLIVHIRCGEKMVC